MKMIIPLLLLIVCIGTTPAISQETNDSLSLEQEIKKIEEEIKKIYQNSTIQNSNTEKISEEINLYFKDQLEELTKLQTMLEKNSREFENLKQVINEIDNSTNKSCKKLKNFEIRNYIIQLVLLGLLIFLIVFVIRFRRQSLDYLLTKANNLSDQNEVIIEKAEELKTIKKNLKSIIAEQKKKEKEVKQVSRKRKKKKK